jgi:hypothetical protein
VICQPAPTLTVGRHPIGAMELGTVVLRGVPQAGDRQIQPEDAVRAWDTELRFEGGKTRRVVPDEDEHTLPRRLEARVAERDQSPQLPHPPVALEADLRLLPDVIEVEVGDSQHGAHGGEGLPTGKLHPEVAHGPEPRRHPDALDLLDLAGEELTLAASHRQAADPAPREEEQVDAGYMEMSVWFEDHRRSVQPRRRPVRDNRIRRRHQPKTFDPERQAIHQLRGVQDAVDRVPQET